MPRRALVIAVFALCAARLAAAQDAAQRLDRERAEASIRAARERPQDAAAELFAAAQLFEQRLGEPARAAELYREVAALAPEGDLGERARRRLDFLAPLLAGDPAVLEAWLAIRQDEGREPAATSAARAEALIAAHPRWPGVAHVELWLGDAARGVGDWDAARAHYRRALERATSAELSRAIHRSRVELALSGGDAAEAEAALADLRAAGELGVGAGPLRDRVVVERRRALWLRGALVGAAAALAVLLGSLATGARSWRRAAAALWPPPAELVYLAPVAAVLVGLAALRFGDVAAAVAAVAAIGLGSTWLSGAGLRLHPRSRRRALVHALAAAVGVCAAIYLVLHQTALLDDLVDTIDFD